MPIPKIAIIGLPNVGKSTLFNRLLGRQEAIVSPIPGTTVDRKEGLVNWEGRNFLIIDTAGVGKADLPVDFQIDQALKEADLVLLVTTLELPQHDVRRKLGSLPTIVVLNKVDDFTKVPPVKNAIAVSGLHGKNINSLLDEIIKFLPATLQVKPQKSLPKIAIVGRPNVGKSTLLNRMVGFERTMVAPTPGTTRDRIEQVWRQAVLVDTAGLRRPSKMKPGIERQAVARALRSIKEADIVLVVVDSLEGLTQQDIKILRVASNQNKSTLLVFNKIDLAQPRNLGRFPFVKKFHPVAISAKLGTNITELVATLEELIQTHRAAKSR